MKIGIATTDYPTKPLTTLFDSIAETGFETVQLSLANLSEAGFTPDGRIEIPPTIDYTLIKSIARTAHDRHLTITSLNGTFNAAHPDPAVRSEGVRRINELTAIAGDLSCEIITLCSGTRNPDYLWSPHPDNGTPQAWADMLDTMKRLADIAERHSCTMAVETEAANVIDAPQKARTMLDSVIISLTHGDGLR